MFKNKEKTRAHRQSGRDKNEIKAFLGAGSQFEGKLSFSEVVRLDGIFRGEIESTDTLIVGESGELYADIKVGSLVFSGRLQGHIEAVDKVELRAPATIEGNITTAVLVVEEGVLINGQIKMSAATSSPIKSTAGKRTVAADAESEEKRS